MNAQRIAQSGQGTDIDHVDEGPSLICPEDRCLGPSLCVLRPAYRVGWIDGQDLADNHPVEQHTQSGQSDLHCGLGVKPELRFHKRCHMDRLDMSEIHDADLGTESGELPNCLYVGAAFVGIADMRAEEVAQARSGFGPRGEDGGP
jgi:hypothetical protein